MLRNIILSLFGIAALIASISLAVYLNINIQTKQSDAQIRKNCQAAVARGSISDLAGLCGRRTNTFPIDNKYFRYSKTRYLEISLNIANEQCLDLAIN